jgi:hypothetical protein
VRLAAKLRDAITFGGWRGRALVGLVLVAAIGGASAAALAAPAGAGTGAATAAAVGGTPTIPAITPAPPGVVTGPVPQVPVTGRPSLADRVIALPSANRCVRRLRVGLVRPRGVHLRTLGVFVGRRHVIRRHVPKAITFHELPRGHFTLKVTVTTTASAKLTRSRRYDHCAQ